MGICGSKEAKSSSEDEPVKKNNVAEKPSKKDDNSTPVAGLIRF
jgi:hypothetical protein